MLWLNLLSGWYYLLRKQQVCWSDVKIKASGVSEHNDSPEVKVVKAFNLFNL